MPAIYSSDQTHALHHTFYDPATVADSTRASDSSGVSDNPDVTVKATLLLVHGMSEHSERYAPLAQFLADNGIAVLTYDQLGHGKTVKSTDDLGFFSTKYPVQTVLKDTVIMADALKARYPDVPHFIMGHSMGSFIVRNVLKHHSHSFSGAILMGTADKDFLVKALFPVFSLLNRFSPKKSSDFIAETTNKILNRKLDEIHLQSHFSWISENTENIKEFEADPLCGFKFTNNGYYTLAVLMDGALNQPWFKNIEASFPMMIVSGKNDPIGNMSKGIHTLVKRLKKHKFSNIKKVIYPNMRHEPLNEINKKIVFSDIKDWIIVNS